MHRLFKVLGSKQRLKLLSHLLQVDGPICYCELEGVVDRDRSVIYRHMKKLEEVGLLKTEQTGKRVECDVRAEEKVRSLLKLAKALTHKHTEVNQGES
jgi:DNA-binding transcriptional ArsR family regulator